MSATDPTTHILIYRGWHLHVSRREYERAMSYAARQAKLVKDAEEYMDWLVGYRKLHPHHPRRPTPTRPSEEDAP